MSSAAKKRKITVVTARGVSKRATKKGQSFRGRDFPECPVNAVTYTGPISSPAYREASDLHTFVIPLQGTIASTAGGVINTVFDAWAQVSSSPSWASLSAPFKECRLLAMDVTFLPWNQYSKATTVITTPVYTVVDRTSSTPLASLSDAASYSSCQIKSLENRFTRAVRMDSVEEAMWVLVSAGPSATSRFYIKYYASGLSNSTTYGEYLTYIVVQFRGV